MHLAIKMYKKHQFIEDTNYYQFDDLKRIVTDILVRTLIKVMVKTNNLLTGAAWWGAGETRAAVAYGGEGGHVHALGSGGKTRLSGSCRGCSC